MGGMPGMGPMMGPDPNQSPIEGMFFEMAGMDPMMMGTWDQTQ